MDLLRASSYNTECSRQQTSDFPGNSPNMWDLGVTVLLKETHNRGLKETVSVAKLQRIISKLEDI